MATEIKNQNRIEPIDPKSSTLEIMTCESLERLAEIQITLVRRVGQFDIHLATERDAKALAAGRSEKRLAIALMELSKQRSKYLRDTTARLNHNFRQIAANHIPASTYEFILEQAKLPLKK